MLIIIIVILLAALIAFYFWGGSGVLEDDQLSQLVTYPVASSQPQPNIESDTFTIMTYNIGYLSGMTNNRLVKPKKDFFHQNMEAVAKYINTNPPHIIAFQEIDYHSRRSFYVDQLETIATVCGYPYAARAVNWDKRYVPFPPGLPSYHFGPVLSGQAILSRFPITATERVVLPKPKSNPFFYNHFYLDRLAQIAKIEIDDQTIFIINVHLEAFNRKTRQAHARQVLELYRTYKDQSPVLIVGDFNAVPPDASRKKGFTDEPESDFTGDQTISLFLKEKSLKPALIGPNLFTFPSDKPTRKLDYIFYTHRSISLVNAKRIQIDSSDHLPLIMEFSFSGGNSNPMSD